MKSFKYFTIMGGSAIFLLIITLCGLVTYAKAEPLRQPATEENKIFNIETGNSPSLGPSNAPVVIIEFSDFQ